MYIILNPDRIFNVDESAFYLNPKGNKYLIGQKSAYAFKIDAL